MMLCKNIKALVPWRNLLRQTRKICTQLYYFYTTFLIIKYAYIYTLIYLFIYYYYYYLLLLYTLFGNTKDKMEEIF